MSVNSTFYKSIGRKQYYYHSGIRREYQVNHHHYSKQAKSWLIQKDVDILDMTEKRTQLKLR